MKVLIDECLPRRLRASFPEHNCLTAPAAGLAGKKNGLLLRLAEELGFEVFLTIDKGLEYQQNLTGRNIAVLIVRAKSNRLEDVLPHVAGCLRAMQSIQAGQVVRVG